MMPATLKATLKATWQPEVASPFSVGSSLL